ncbi:MAG: hypothetical protein JWM12_2891 [Ilumatobacteraceae bacterium]|nr:hypothetical protein [Ilumatobacteraceae bacterium]
MLNLANGASSAVGVAGAVTRCRVAGAGAAALVTAIVAEVPPTNPPSLPAPQPPPGPPAAAVSGPYGGPIGKPLPPPPAVYEPRPLVRGQLTSGWRNLFVAGWIGVILGLAGVWKSAWTLGFPTWWLGPQADPRFPLLVALPFVCPVLLVVAGLRNMRYLPYAGIVAAIVAENIAWGDVGHEIKFAVVEFALAGGGLVISIAALAGLVRAQPDVAVADPAVEEPRRGEPTVVQQGQSTTDVDSTFARPVLSAD